MIKKKKNELFLIGSLVLTVFFINLPVVYTYFYHDITGDPKAFDGVIDLSYVDNIDKKIYLDGEWEFYWKHFIVSEREEFHNPDLIMKVPDEWSNYKINGEYLPAGGFASYRLNMIGIQHENNVSLFIPDFGGAYKVFIDGTLVAESGIVSKNIDKIFTVPKTNLYPLTLSAGLKHEVVIEVATKRFSGLYMTPILSNYHQTMSENNLRNAIRFILFGIALFCFLSLLAMYTMIVRRKLLFYWMPIIIFFILIRIMLTSEFYSLWQPVLFFDISYESTNELMYFTTFVLKYMLIFFVQEQCGIEFSKGEKIGFLFYYLCLYFIYLFIPQSLYNNYLSVLVPMLSYVLDIYMFAKIYRDRGKLKKFSISVYWCGILIIMGLAIDSYYINGKIYMDMSMTLLLLFTLCAIIIVCIYVMRSIDLYDDFAISYSRLEFLNSQINIQKEHYNALRGQINEVREMKHDIHHFIGVMRRLVDDGELDKLKIFLSEYGEKIKKEDLPIFCENVVANSIIGYYYLQAKKYGINFESRCNFESEIPISDSDICIILGNALENAIDACRQMDNTQMRFVSAQAGKIKNQRLLMVKNSYSGRIEVRDGQFITSKASKSHGFGIRNIEKVIESYGGFVKIEYDEKEFTLMLATPEK